MKASGNEFDHHEMLSRVAVMRTKRQRRNVQDTVTRYLVSSLARLSLPAQTNW